MDNYEFCISWIVAQRRDDHPRVLDYGCGAGQLVGELRALGIDAFGCDPFYEGGDYAMLVDPALLKTGVVTKMTDLSIPFASASFDFVVNNQVMEHVEHLNIAISEIHRVLKPGGSVLSIFPHREVWREGHCGIPFLHRFPKRSRARVWYATTFRLFGFGYHTEKKSRIQWSRDFCDWLDRWTHYRSQEDIDATYRAVFPELQHVEDYWLRCRLGKKGRLLGGLPCAAQKYVARCVGGVIFVARKRG